MGKLIGQGYGGPVHTHRITALSNRRCQGSEEIAPGVFMYTAHDSNLDRIVRDVASGIQVGPEEELLQVRLFQGLACWAPYQLDGEVRAGAWRLVEPRVGELIGDNQGLWDSLVLAGRAEDPPL